MQLSLTEFTSRRPWEAAEERVRRFVEEYSPRVLYAMWSGGKDSTAATAAVLNASPVPAAVVTVVVPGLTHPDATRTVLEAWRRLCPGCRVERLAASGILARVARVDEHTLFIIAPRSPTRDFWSGVERWGLPTPLRRWCRSEYKDRVFRLLPPNGVHGGRPARMLTVGVRRGESAGRRRRWRTPVTIFDAGRVVDVALSPVYDMSEEEVWSTLRHYGVHDIIRRVYDEWGNAPNCVLCPMRSDELNKRAMEKLPTGYLLRARQAIESGMRRFRPGTLVYEKSRRWLELVDQVLAERLSRGRG